MNPVALEFIITGLNEFTSGVNQANGVLEKLAGSLGTVKDAIGKSVFETVWDSAGEAISNFGKRVWDVASVTLGVLLRDAIRGTIDLLSDLARSAFEAGAELQQVSLRLQGFNMQTLVDAGVKYTDAMTKAVDITKQQLSWIMQLAATTPYDATDIAFVFSMSEAFGYTAEQSKILTQNTLDFVAAMGLTGVEAKRIIINLGQMAQRGKITTREMNDLARGSLVPLRDILDRVAKKMNTTTAELTKMIAKPGEGVDYKLFMDAFNEMIQQEERFIGAGSRMAHTFKGAMENVYQTLRDLIGNFILLPAFLDPIGKRVGDLMDTIGEEKNWKAITSAVERIGLSLQGITTQILDAFFPSTARQTVVDRIVSTLNSISDWLKIHQKDIVDFFLGTETWKPFGETEREGGLFKDIGKIVQDVTGFVNNLVKAFNTISDWVTKNKPTIDEFFKTLGEIAGTVLKNIFGDIFGEAKAPGLEGILETVKLFMQFVIDNKDKISEFATTLTKMWLAIETGKLVLGGLLDMLIGILSMKFGAKIVGLFASFESGKGMLKTISFFSDVWTLIMSIGPALESLGKSFSIFGTTLTNVFSGIKAETFISIGKTILIWVLEGLQSMLNDIRSFFMGGKEGSGLWNQLLDTVDDAKWVDMGARIVKGIIDGLLGGTSSLLSVMGNLGMQAVSSFLGAFGLGGLLPQNWTGGGGTPKSGGGGKEGNKFTALPIVNNATALVSIPTAASSSISSANVVNNFMNLTVNTAAQRESVIQDYEMLRSMMS